MIKIARLAILFAAFACGQAAALTWDTSGNGMLNGTYYFREVIYILGDSSGDLGQAVALYGTVNFNGSGSFSMAVTAADSSVGSLQSGTVTGTYSIAASGQGFLNMSIYGGYTINGLVNAQGIFVGSATESGFNDLFIAAPLASPAPTNATFKGTYTLSAIDLSSGSPLTSTGYQFTLNPDGAGNLGNVVANGYIGEAGNSLFTQTLTGQKYSFSNGGCNLAFPNTVASTAYFLNSGQKFLYISPDGNFVFGGSPTSWDMFVGVRTGTGTPSLSGLYYEAGIDEDDTGLGSGYGLLDTYYGSLNASNGAILDHQRTLNLLVSSAPYGNVFSDAYTLKSDGTYNNGLMRYLVGAGGVRIGSGIGPSLGLNVALAAPTLSGSGVYLYPTGVLNSGSNAPFTAGIAPGELLTLYGANLAPSLTLASTTPWPTTLGGVQVMISGLPAPIYYVSSTQISVVVPYAVTGTTAQVQVINNGNPSNTVSTLVNQTVPGIFTQNQNGLGYAAVTHTDGSLVTPSHQAAIGETVSLYLTGLGAVTPLVSDGSAGPVSPLSQTTNTIGVDLQGVPATVGYAGLAPQLVGLYQINFTVPTGVSTGDNFLDISGPDSYNAQALISIGTNTSSASQQFVSRLARRLPAPPATRRVLNPKTLVEPGLHHMATPLGLYGERSRATAPAPGK